LAKYARPVSQSARGVVYARYAGAAQCDSRLMDRPNMSLFGNLQKLIFR